MIQYVVVNVNDLNPQTLIALGQQGFSGTADPHLIILRREINESPEIAAPTPEPSPGEPQEETPNGLSVVGPPPPPG